MTTAELNEEKLTPNLILLESEDSDRVEDRTLFLQELGWRESFRSFTAGKYRALLEKAA